MTKAAFIGSGGWATAWPAAISMQVLRSRCGIAARRRREDLIARGARWASSPAEAADGADAVVTMVANDEASRAVWLGKDGAASKMKAGSLAIECSTVSHRHALDMARELRGRGLVPVSRAALTAYEKAKANAPDDDEGRMIEIVSQPK